ncbi:hypothetical protein K7432_015582 [Basidiobolus ranarum]|uniref:Myosin motor domain-containing protein n=1 Tax=Basidiobolus ranarum TaxID=34480 RepID=A0ABR2WG09_9FUNG
MDSLANKSKADVSDQDLLEAFDLAQNSHDNYISPPGESRSAFAIRHYSGKASYPIQGFMEKNLGSIGSDFIGLFCGGSDVASSTNTFIAGLFSDKTVSYQSHPRNNSTIITAQQSAAPTRKPSTRRTRNNDKESKTKVNCVATQFQQAIDDLVDTLGETTPWFVLCLRPSIDQVPNSFDFHHVKSQVRHLGLSQVIERQKIEYTSSISYEDFVARYGNHIDLHGPISRETLGQFRSDLGWSDTDMVLGKTNGK